MPQSLAEKIVDKVDAELRLLDHDFLPAIMVDRPVFLSDDAWEILAPLLPPERGRVCRPAQDNRRYFEAMVWIARTGARWRQLPAEYGKWNSIFRRYRRWVASGVFSRLIEQLRELNQGEAGDHSQAPLRQALGCAAHILDDLSRVNKRRN